MLKCKVEKGGQYSELSRIYVSRHSYIPLVVLWIDILFLESNLAKVIQFSIFTSFDQAIILLKVYCKDILYTSTERGRHSCNVVIKKYEIVGIHFIFLCIAMHTDMVR